MWSNGCSRQFKSAHAWYIISQYPNLISDATFKDGCQMLDGAGALMW
jgi:hypothetical protein